MNKHQLAIKAKLEKLSASKQIPIEEMKNLSQKCQLNWDDRKQLIEEAQNLFRQVDNRILKRKIPKLYKLYNYQGDVTTIMLKKWLDLITEG